KKRLGKQLGCRQCHAGTRSRTVTGSLATASMDHTAKNDDLDFELFGIFAAACFQRLAARRADLVRLGQVKDLLPRGQVAVIAAPGSRLAGLSPAWTQGLSVGRVVQFLGAVAGGLFLGAASKPFGLQLADFTAELLDVLLRGRETLHGVGMSALPIA